jgi:hypothetical protein
MNVGAAKPRGSAAGGSLTGMADASEIVAFVLTDEERLLLQCGLVACGGPASCSDAMAVAMGFASVRDLFSESDCLEKR